MGATLAHSEALRTLALVLGQALPCAADAAHAQHPSERPRHVVMHLKPQLRDAPACRRCTELRLVSQAHLRTPSRKGLTAGLDGMPAPWRGLLWREAGLARITAGCMRGRPVHCGLVAQGLPPSCYLMQVMRTI